MATLPQVTAPVRAVPVPPASAPVQSETSAALVRSIDFSETALATLKMSASCAKLSDIEFRMFVEMARRRQLDPFCKQIFAIVRDGERTGRTVTYQTSIDGFRVIAARTGEYEGQVGPYWADANGRWCRAWLTGDKPAAARVGVYRRGFRAVLWGVARFAAYYQPGGAGLWDRMPDNQIAKCAEALALRKAFPEDLGSLYIGEEMEQAGPELVGEVVERDMKPANVSQAAPPAPSSVPLLTPENAAIATYADAFARVTTLADLNELCREVVHAGGGAKASPAFRTWFEEMRSQALAAIGPKGGRR
jgi:phage recombination protein Bet